MRSFMRIRPVLMGDMAAGANAHAHAHAHVHAHAHIHTHTEGHSNSLANPFGVQLITGRYNSLLYHGARTDVGNREV